MRINAIILTLSKKVKKVKVDSELDFSFEGCLYELDPNKVCNKLVKDRKGRWILKDQVAVYFEGNPNPIGYSDTSTDLREQTILDNALRQVAGVKPRGNKRKIAVLMLAVCLLVLGLAFWLTQLGGLSILEGLIMK